MRKLVDLFEKLTKAIGVEFIHSESKPQKDNLLPDAISRGAGVNIPQAYLAEMRKAVDDGDIGQLLKLIDQMVQYDKLIAENLRDLAQQVQFNALRSIL